MKFFISIICAFLLSISLHAEKYLSSQVSLQNSVGIKSNIIAKDNLFIAYSGSLIYIYEDDQLLNYFSETMIWDIDQSAGFYNFKLDSKNRRLVFCSDSGMVTYNINTEEVKFIKTGFRVNFFDVYNSVALISNGYDFVWWDLDKGEIKREAQAYTDDIMFRMVDESRFILYHAKAAYLYSAGNYEKLFDAVELLLPNYADIQIYQNYLLYKPQNKSTVVFNMTTKQKEAEFDNPLHSQNELSFNDGKVYYSNNNGQLCIYDLASRKTEIKSNIHLSQVFGKNGNIYYRHGLQVYLWNPDTEVSKQVIRSTSGTQTVKLEIYDDKLLVLTTDHKLCILNKDGDFILDLYLDLANYNAYSMINANTLYYQNSSNQIIAYNIQEQSAKVVLELDYEIEQLFVKDGKLYCLDDGKVYELQDGKKFALIRELEDCHKVEIFDDSSIYYYTNIESEEDYMFLNKLDIQSDQVICDSTQISKFRSYKNKIIIQNDTLYLREYNRVRYLNPNTLETVKTKNWKNNIRFVDFEKYQDDILLSTYRKISDIHGKINEIEYQSRKTPEGTNIVDIALDDNRCYWIDSRDVIYYEDITPTGVWEDREEVHSIDSADYITVYDIQGEKIGEFTSYSVCIDNLLRGKYILEYTVAKKRYFKQIIRL